MSMFTVSGILFSSINGTLYNKGGLSFASGTHTQLVYYHIEIALLTFLRTSSTFEEFVIASLYICLFGLPKGSELRHLSNSIYLVNVIYLYIAKLSQ